MKMIGPATPAIAAASCSDIAWVTCTPGAGLVSILARGMGRLWLDAKTMRELGHQVVDAIAERLVRPWDATPDRKSVV